MSYYVHDNFFEGWGYKGHPRHWEWGGPNRAPKWVQFNQQGQELEAPAATPDIATTDAKEAMEQILEKAGCWPRDRVTRRTIEEVRTKAGAWGRHAPLEPSDDWYADGLEEGDAQPDSDDDGIPDFWEISRDLDPNNPTDALNVVTKGASKNDRHFGYTYLEYYLNELADELVASK